MLGAATDLLGVIADDFTGALDAGVEFVRAGLDTTLRLLPECAEPARVRVINTDSRAGTVAAARRRVAEASGQLAGRRLFKKIDSTMRGHIGPEIAAVLSANALAKAVVCPAAIEAGRTVERGRLLINGVPLHETDFARDPAWPARTSDMIQLAGGAATQIALATVRAGAAALAVAIAAAPTAVVTVDACSHADLEAISQAIAASNSLPCGALGLARAWARGFAHAAPASLTPPARRQAGPVLLIAGSHHPHTIAQVDRLIAERAVIAIEVGLGKQEQRRQEWMECTLAALAAGTSVTIRAPAQPIVDRSAQRALVDLLADLTAHVCQGIGLGGLVLTGGETASAICRRLGVAGIRILGELEVGIPWGQVVGGVAAGLPLVTKAGGFGRADALIRAVDMRH